MDSIQYYEVLLSKNTVLKDEVRFITVVLAEISLSERALIVFLDQANFIRPKYFEVNLWNLSNLLYVLKSWSSGALFSLFKAVSDVIQSKTASCFTCLRTGRIAQWLSAG